MAVTSRGEPRRWLAGRGWKFGQALWALALLALVALKLTGVIGWSWWWVLLPLWTSCLAVPLTLSGRGTGTRVWNLGAQVAVPALVVLKLTGVIAWSWWWVFSPLWISGLIALPILCVPLGLIWWSIRHADA